jgi:ribose/xylose/arabinose/galactoside ABC-type transport system permease subunit
MNAIRRVLASGSIFAWLWLGALACLFFGLSEAGATRFGAAAVFSVMENFATFGLVALGLGLTLLVREFDISMAGMFSLAGCVAVLLGNVHPALGIAGAAATGLCGGAMQGLLLVRLNLGSVPVTLGGLLTFYGIAYVLTGNRTISFGDLDVALAVNTPVLGVFSVRSVATLALFALASVVVAHTRIGRDMIAIGGDARAAAVAGVETRTITVGVFAASGTLFALAGALMAFSLSTASPGGLSDVTVPAVAAVILGGASLARGTARPLGIMAGVLVLCLIRTGLTSLGASPHLQEIILGALLMSAAIADCPDWARLRSRLWRGRRAAAGEDG